MPDIRPFRAWRYDTGRAGDLASVIAPPYDVISPDQQKSLYAKSQYNIVRVELTASESGDPAGQEGDAARHQRARATLEAWKDDGILRKDSEPALYLYRQSFNYGGRKYDRRSIIAAVRLFPWSAGGVLPHERTLAGPRAERLALLRALNANVSPIWSLFEDPDRHVATAIDSIADAEGDPLVEQVATDGEGVEHGITAVTARQPVDLIRRALAEHPLFIADGHHRYETALSYRDEALAQTGPRDVGPRDFVLMVLTDVADPGLIILPTHRLISGLTNKVLEGLPERVNEHFAVSIHPLPADPAALVALVEKLLPGFEGREPAHRFALVGAVPGKLLVLEPNAESVADVGAAPTLQSLDVWLAQTLVLERELGLTAADVELKSNVTYSRDAAFVAKQVASGATQLGLLLGPTPVSQLMAVSRAGEVMPQKSTYFYPKPATGLTLRVFEAN